MDDAHFFDAWFPILGAKAVLSVGPPLDKVASNYYANMQRVHDSLLSTACFVGVSARMAWAEVMAQYDVERKMEQSYESPDEDSIDAYFAARCNHYILEQIRLDGEHPEGAASRLYGQGGQFMLNAMKRYPSFPLKGGLEATLSSVIIHASSAMEVCLKELSETVCLQPVIQQRKRQITDKKTARTNQSRIFFLAQDKRSVPRLLPDSVRPSYTSLGGCRMKYSDVFDCDFADLDEAMASYDLDIVALVRNVLVHNNGMPDGLFREQAKGIPVLASAVALSDADQIPLTGKFVSSILTSSLRAMTRVILSVDQWLQRNK